MKYVSTIAALCSLCVAIAPAATVTWLIGDGSEVVFTSRAPLESFDGKTRQVSGHITCAPDDLIGPVDLRIEVDLASLDTGIGLRDRHMRDRHLETDEHPVAVFTGEAVTASSQPALSAEQAVEIVVQGRLSLHGITQPRVVTATVLLTAEGNLRVETEFEVKLSDHDIDRPRFLVMKLADEQEVRVDLAATPGGGR